MTTIHFYLRFSSKAGQQFFVTGNTDALGNEEREKAVALNYLNSEWWHVAVHMPKSTRAFEYRYILKEADGSETEEWPTERMADPEDWKRDEIQLADVWNYAGLTDNVYFTQPFQETLLPQHKRHKLNLKKQHNFVFKVKAPVLKANETVCVCGEGTALGNWSTDAPLLLQRDKHWYAIPLNLEGEHFPLHYKYGVYNTETNQLVRWEDGDNRVLHGTVQKQLVVLHDGFIRIPQARFRGAGVAIPVFSLRSAQSFGIGEFTDIKPLADWCHQTGLKLIQLLPINDTTSTFTRHDSYPYSAISAFALHPIYLNLQQLAGEEYLPLIEKELNEQPRLNRASAVDYDHVVKFKWAAIKKLFSAQYANWRKDKAYKKFQDENKHWLKPYAAFCYFRNKYQTANFNAWPEHSQFKKSEIDELFDEKASHFPDLAIHKFVQYHLHLQLRDAVEYCHNLGLIVKGDIPIGIYRDSCDAWQQPELYNMHEQAGAPPDDFAVAGQNWGFPTYNWSAMQSDGFKWWKQRFRQMSVYFDAFRIDHILGFFRIWSIPRSAVQGIMGRFVPCLPIYLHEFAERGIWFDYQRYCRPFITRHLVQDWFKEEANMVMQTFLEDHGRDQLAFKENLATQRQVEIWFAENKKEEIPDWVQGKLYDLLSNVLMFEEPNTNASQFHFRFGMPQTESFKHLDGHLQYQLNELYVDYFFRRQESFWRKEAMQKLPALKASTNMLICGEDLGMVPACVPGVMNELGLLSLEIQRMPKDPKKTFFHPADAPYLSVVTPSTHDMSTVRGWWEEDREQTQVFYNYELGMQGNAPYFCEAWINQAIVNQHVYSPAMWSIFQLQDLLGMDAALRRENPNDERINVPADANHYWKYRMHLSLEQLQQATAFNGELRQLLINSGRA